MSMSIMPDPPPVWIALGSWNVFASRIRPATLGVVRRISHAATRPRPSRRGRSVWEMTAFSESAIICGSAPCWSGGNALMIRSTVEDAVVVCSVASTRWPVSAAVIASAIVSRSRISPTRMTSGSSRSDCRSARAKERECAGISRWLTSASLFAWTYSIGSSMVRMWHRSVSLIRSTRAASVVVLPQPAGPVTRMRPCE